jgi:hypothetical protein
MVDIDNDLVIFQGLFFLAQTYKLWSKSKSNRWTQIYFDVYGQLKRLHSSGIQHSYRPTTLNRSIEVMCVSGPGLKVDWGPAPASLNFIIWAPACNCITTYYMGDGILWSRPWQLWKATLSTVSRQKPRLRQQMCCLGLASTFWSLGLAPWLLPLSCLFCLASSTWDIGTSKLRYVSRDHNS